MGPAFIELSRPARAPGQGVEVGKVIASQATEQRQIVRADQGIDRVDLQHVEACSLAVQGGQAGAALGLATETLGTQGQAPGLAQGKAIHPSSCLKR